MIWLTIDLARIDAGGDGLILGIGRHGAEVRAMRRDDEKSDGEPECGAEEEHCRLP